MATKTKTPEYIQMGDGSAAITLSRPLEIDGARVLVLTLREPTVADQLAAEANKRSEAEQEIAMLANLCMVQQDDIKRLTLRDYKRLQAAFLLFIV